MIRVIICLLSLTMLLWSCGKSEKQSPFEKNIIGNWVEVKIKPANSNNIVLEFPERHKSGFSFFANYKFEDKLGFYKKSFVESRLKLDDDDTVRYTSIGNSSKYIIDKNDLKLFDPATNNWNTHKIIKLTADSLLIEFDDRIRAYKRFQIKKNNNPEFDKIILSTSGCYGRCPCLSIAIDADGNVLFRGQSYTAKKGLFIGKISKETQRQLQNNFRKTDFDLLNPRYDAGWTDDETITVVFIKDGKIYKSVSDYGRQAPYLFTWAYIPFANLYQTIPLKNIQYPDYLSDFFNTNEEFRRGSMVSDLSQSEFFLLFSHLFHGKQYSGKFKPRFTLRKPINKKQYFDIKTDGRYYTFQIKGKPVTIDIGFNFYDVNSKNWQWRKVTEYD